MSGQNKYNKNWNDFGENLKDSIGDAISHGDFGSINDFIRGTVSDAINDVGDAIDGMGDAVSDALSGAFGGRHGHSPYNGGRRNAHRNYYYGRKTQNGAHQNYHYGSEPQNGAYQNYHCGREQRDGAYRHKEPNINGNGIKGKNINENGIYYPKAREENKHVKKIGATGAILCNIFGGMGLGATGLIGLFVLSSAAMMGTFATGMMILPAFCACLFGSLIHRGTHILNRINRAVRYAEVADEDEYVTMDYLSAATGRSKKYITKDIQKMLELGIYPEGHLDKQKTCLILTDKMYQTYLNSEESRHAAETEKAKKADKASKSNSNTEKTEKSDPEGTANLSGSENKEFDEMMAEGNECIKKLRDLNDLIEGEVISEKLYKLENLLREIFAYVKVHPEKMGKIHKLMNYYLPTTLKLVEAYSEFDDIKEPGADVENAKKQIEGTLDTINEAFNELQNSMMRDKVYDVTTDAEVLKTMLSKEGLINKDFAKK